MKNRTFIIGAGAVLVVLLAVPFAFAQHMHARGLAMHGPEGRELGGAMMLGHLVHAQKALDLTDQQVADIKAIFQELHAQNAQYREQLHGGLKAVADALIANPNDVAAAQALLDKQEATEHQMKANALAAAAKALNVLTPEQRGKLAEHVAEHGRRFEK